MKPSYYIAFAFICLAAGITSGAGECVTLTEKASQGIVTRGSAEEGRYVANVSKTTYTVQCKVPLDRQRSFSSATLVSFYIGDLVFEAELSQALKSKLGIKGSALFVCSTPIYNDEGEVSKVIKYAAVKIKWTAVQMTVKITGKAKYIDDDSLYYGYGDGESDLECNPPLCSGPDFDESIFEGPGSVSGSTSVTLIVSDGDWNEDIDARCAEVNFSGLVKSTIIIKKYREEGETYEDEYPVASYNVKGSQTAWD